MKFSQLVVSGAFALVVVFAFAEARYNSAPAYPAAPSYPAAPAYPAPAPAYGAPKAYDEQPAAPASNYGGYGSNRAAASSDYQNRQRSPYGPYHSYKVKPALYGGRGLYHYMGYARHYPSRPSPAHYRAVRSYKPAKASYGLRPVKALVLAPAYNSGNSGNSGYSRANSNRYNGGASAGNNYRQKRAYKSAPSYQAAQQTYSGANQQSAYRSSSNARPAYAANNYNRGASRGGY